MRTAVAPQQSPILGTLTARQEVVRDLLAGPQRHTKIVGGARSGKTWLFIRAIFARAIKAAGSRHVIIRLRSNAVHKSVWLDTLPKVHKTCFPSVQVTTRNNEYYELANGSQIWVGGLDDQERVDKILGQEYCVDPSARVLTADLRWICADTLVSGDQLIAFPEDLDGRMRLIRSIVGKTKIINARRFRITTSRGETIVSGQHRFVGYYDDRRTKNFRSLSWIDACSLKVGDHIRYAHRPWDAGTTYDNGWLAGIYDGEGWISKVGDLGVAQKPGLVLEKICDVLDSAEIPYRRHDNDEDHCTTVHAQNLWESLEILGRFRPVRLMAKAELVWENRCGFMAWGKGGSRNTSSGEVDENGRHVATVTAIEDLGVGPVVALSTSSRTLIADGFLGHNSTMFFNECSQIAYASILVARSRLAQKCPEIRNRAYYDLNPVGKGYWTYKLFVEKKNPASPLESIADPDQYQFAYMNPEDNADNIDAEFLNELRNYPERQRRRFYDGVYVDQDENALWSLEAFEKNYIKLADMPALQRIVIAVDPSGASGPTDLKADEIGIVIVGRGVNGHYYVLEDNTGLYSPEQWGKIVREKYHIYQADRVIGEKNFGGDMVRAVIQQGDANVSYKDVVASRGKVLRAEPVSALYERCVAIGTQIQTGNGQKAIECIVPGEQVWTRKGLRRVLWSGQTGERLTVKLRLDAGELVCTPDHLIYVKGRGFIQAVHTVPKSSKLVAWGKEGAQTAELVLREDNGVNLARLWNDGRLVYPFGSSSSLMEFVTSWIHKVIGEVVGIPDFGRCTAMCGPQLTEQFQMNGKSTILTAILQTIPSEILSLSPLKDIERNTPIWVSICAITCIVRRLARNGRLGGRIVSRWQEFVINAVRSLSLWLPAFDFAPLCVTHGTTLGAVESSQRLPVYNLKVEDEPEFFANGVLVHNCLVHHVGRLPKLEDELCSFSTAGYLGIGSPNRADALVHGLTELCGGGGGGWLDFYRAEAGLADGDPDPVVITPNMPAYGALVPQGVNSQRVNSASQQVWDGLLGRL